MTDTLYTVDEIQTMIKSIDVDSCHFGFNETYKCIYIPLRNGTKFKLNVTKVDIINHLQPTKINDIISASIAVGVSNEILSESIMMYIQTIHIDNEMCIAYIKNNTYVNGEFRWDECVV